MKLNHLNLAVSDVIETQLFFEKYFGFRRLMPGSPAFAVLRGEDGFTLTLSNLNKASSVEYPEDFHVGFVQETEARVTEINQLLRADGYDVPEPRKSHNSWTFYFRAPGGLLLEVLC
jgi:lactoylglutathione lyase